MSGAATRPARAFVTSSERAGTVEDTPPEGSGDRRRLVIGLHWASLLVAFGFLLWATRDQWFDSDEWAFLVRRRLIGSEQFLGVWAPHNKHWSTLPVLTYRALFTLFGVRTYLPYMVVLLLLQVAVAHLLWRLMLRLGVEGLLATAAAAVFAFAGAGWENVTGAFQLAFIGSLLLGLGAVLVVHDRDLTRGRYALVWLLLVGSLMFSGVGITMVAVVVVMVLLRDGVQRALITVSVPAAAYLVWFGLEVLHAPPGAGEQPLRTALQAAPEFLWRGLTAAVDAETGLAGTGAVLLVLLAIWALRHADPSDSSWRDATVLALGGVLFLGLTAIGRSGLGPDAGTASRYAYITIALLLPLTAIALDHLLGSGITRWVAMILGLGLLLLVAVSTVSVNANEAGLREQEQKRLVIATWQFLQNHEPFLGSVPVPLHMPDLDVEAIRRLGVDGKLPTGVDLSEADVLTARLFLQFQISDAVSPASPGSTGVARLVGVTGATATPDADAPGCVRVVPASDSPTVALLFPEPGAATIRTDQGGNVAAWLENPASGATGGHRDLLVPGDRLQQIQLAHGALVLHLDIGAVGASSLCGLAAG
jgi:hypothetical protein